MLWRSLGSDTRSHSFEKCSIASSDSRTLLPSLVRPEPFSLLGCANWRTSAWSSAGGTAIARHATSIGLPNQGVTCFLYSSLSKSGVTCIVGITCKRWCFSTFAEQNFIQRPSASPAGSRCDSTSGRNGVDSLGNAPPPSRHEPFLGWSGAKRLAQQSSVSGYAALPPSTAYRAPVT